MYMEVRGSTSILKSNLHILCSVCFQVSCLDVTGYRRVKTYELLSHLRDWPLITGRGSYKMGGWACEVLPLQKNRAEKVLAMLKGVGGTTSFGGSFYMVA